MRESVYSLNQYKVIKKYDKFTKTRSYIIVNTKLKGFAHTHINNKDTAIQIVKNCVYRRTPRTVCLYLLNSHLRVAQDRDYRTYIDGIIKSIEHNVDPNYNFIKYPMK